MQLSLPLAELRMRADRALFAARVFAAAVRVAFERPPAARPTPPVAAPNLSPEERAQSCAALDSWQSYADWRRSIGDHAGADRLDYGIEVRRRIYACK
jgi:hypothetical protein